MITPTSKDLIAVLQTTVDGRILDGGSEWVDSWADGLESLPAVDAFVLGGGMFGGYEHFWPAVLDDPEAAKAMLGRAPYPREVAYAQLAAKTEHLVVSTTLTSTTWANARIVRSIDEIREFKHDGPGTAYVVGGPTLIKSLVDADLLDELRLLVRPVVTGTGQSVSELISSPRRLQLAQATEQGAPESVTYTSQLRLVR